MKKFFLLATFMSSAALAQTFSGVVVPSNKLDRPNYQTYANMNLFVDPTGSDINSCIGTGTAACATITGAFAKVPKGLRHIVDISVADGTYTGVQIMGFWSAPQVVANGAYIRLHGTPALATVATGTNTGTATAGTAGSNNTFGTLTDGTQTWTVNNLKGKYIAKTAGPGTGEVRVIASNTATAITIAGTWTAPTGASTYEIRQNNARITTGIFRVAGPGVASSQLQGVYVMGNAVANNPTPYIALEDLEIDSTTMAVGLYLGNLQGITLNRVSFVSTAGTSSLITAQNSTSLRMTQCSVRQTAAAGLSAMTATFSSTVIGGGSGLAITQSLIESNTSSNTVASFGGYGGSVSSTQFNSTNAAASGANAAIIRTASPFGAQQWNTSNFTCASAAAAGLLFTDDANLNGQSSWGGNTFAVTGCASAISATGKFKIFAAGTNTLTAGTSGVIMALGANIQVSTGTTTTGGTQDYFVDGVAFTSAQLAALSPAVISNSQYGTFVLRQ